jgi:hypothetical protein
MLPGHRSLLLGVFPLLLLAGCGSSSSSNGYSTGSANVASGSGNTGGGGTVTGGFGGAGGTTGTHDAVIATPSTAATVVPGARQTVSVTFASDDGRAISGFGISDSLGKLPAGWSGPSSFVCASVSTGSGCVLNLTYTPPAVGSGTFNLDYVYVDNATMPRTGYSVTVAYAATAQNNINATTSPTGQVNAIVGAGSQPVSVNFTTDDGNAATGLIVSTDLAHLPSGWKSMTPSLSCDIVSTGSGCQLALIYAPPTAGSGVLTLNYAYTDDSGAPKRGALNIPYATASQNVVAAASPPSQVNAVEKTGGQAVAVTFTTDDGKTANSLVLTSDLAALPPGWSSTSHGFSCGSVSSGNGCQLPLTYAPTALASGTLTLNYAYKNGAGTANAGSLNVTYAATTNDNVVGTASPSGQINAVVPVNRDMGTGSQVVSVTFTTDDGRPATALQLTSSLTALPLGWSSTNASFACSGINSGNGCQLLLTYAPTAAGSGMLPLNYAYKNDAGASKTGSVNIAYRATTNNSVVGAPTVAGTPIANLPPVRTGSSTVVDVDFATDDGNPATALSVDLSALPAGWSAPKTFGCASVNAGTSCRLSLIYAPTTAFAGGTLLLGFAYANDAEYTKTGNVSIHYSATTPYLYVANANSANVSSCAINADNSLGACGVAAATPVPGFITPYGIALYGSYAYVTDTNGNSVYRCILDTGGVLSSCVAPGVAFNGPTFIATNSLGTFAYISQSTGLTVCAVGAGDGSLSSCKAAASAGSEPLSGIALSADGVHTYSVHATGTPPTQTSVIEVCSVALDGRLMNCAAAAANAPLAGATLAIQNNYLYVSTLDGALYACQISGATLGSCQSAAVGVFPNGLAFSGTTAYLSSNSTTILTCPVNADGTLGNCMPFADPSFHGTAGMVVR